MSRKEEIKDFVIKKITSIEKESKAGDGRVILAQLRSCIGKKPGENPKIFGLLLQNMPETFYSKTGIVTKEEWACFLALTLYALHQQGVDCENESMNTNENVSIGTAMKKFAKRQDDLNAKDRMQEKYKVLATAIDIVALSNYLRSIIKLLKRENIKLNYALLASDLYEIQFDESKSKVILRWGQDLYRYDKMEDL